MESIFNDPLPIDTHSVVSGITDSSSLYGTKQATTEGTTFVVGSGIHSEFKEIKNILLIGSDIFFLLKDYETWYVEHLQSYELTDHNKPFCEI